eukprot:TRINITY_DN836_c0_g3_i1.p1 TRINITY_DN836_c0_g3~~TRINITY_DN836_c0_g3_i1.p1  ORF type:complete len:835 (-),score=221.66 TRINITY_DN836_c0_g3_i1:91-2517(-)
MGFGQNLWMSEVLDLLDNIVSNFRNVARVQEESYVMTIRINNVAPGKVNLAEFKSCMLASLRSLLPKEWTTQHEVAWSWCWERVEGAVLENMGKPPRWQKALVDLLGSIDDATGFQLRQDTFLRFFALSSEGEGYFKQNMSYLHLIVTKILAFCMQMYTDPVTCCDEISALGLRHVGYAIPLELLMPFVGICISVIRDLGAEEVALKAFSWSLTLLTQMMSRVIAEGSTIVMKAVNVNSPVAVRSAIACAARGARAECMLLVKVGTRDISPFLWSVQSGAIEAAHAMLTDLLTIRADRDKYYYEADRLFRRHPDIINTFLQDAPLLIMPLLDGLIWRSRLTRNGLRRTNYYLKHLLLNHEGKFQKTLEWFVKANDPKLMVHPMLVLLSDVIWSRVAMRSFVQRKAWFVFTLVIFVLSQSIITGYNEEDSTDALRYTTFVLRILIYIFSMGHMLFQHTEKIIAAYKTGNTMRLAKKLSVPAYLANWQDSFNFILMLMLVAMLCNEPVLHCIPDDGGNLLTDQCESIPDIRQSYHFLNMLAMFLYYVLLLDLAVFNNRLSAYVLVCGRMLSEIALFLFAMFSTLLTLSSAFSCLEQGDEDFKSIPSGFISMWEMLLGMYRTEHYAKLNKEPIVRMGVYVYLVIAVIFLLNLLIAQLTCSYDAIYADMVGYARLKRSRIIVETMPMVSAKRWVLFRETLVLDSPIEFNEGDVGISGGIQVEEPAGLHPTTVDAIRRFGGTTSPLVQWPDEADGSIEDDRFGRLEAMIKKAMDAMAAKSTKKKKQKGHASSSGMSGSGSKGGEENSYGEEEE